MRKTIFTMSLLLFFGVGLYAQPRAVGEPRMLAQSEQRLHSPAWSADGTTLFLNNGTMEVSVDGTNLRNAAVPVSNLRRAASGNPLLQQMIDNPVGVVSQVAALSSRFAEGGYMVFNPVLSPQGDRIVFEVSFGGGMYIINTDGTGLRSLGTRAERASWTADGRYVVAMQTEDDGRSITKGRLISIDAASGARNVLFASDSFITFNPAISPDGRRLAFEDYATGVIYILEIQ